MKTTLLALALGAALLPATAIAYEFKSYDELYGERDRQWEQDARELEASRRQLDLDYEQRQLEDRIGQLEAAQREAEMDAAAAASRARMDQLQSYIRSGLAKYPQ